MRKIIFLMLGAIAIAALASCTFEGTATFHLKNNTSHTITAVNFVAVSGGETDNNAVSIDPDDGRYFYRIEPGTYDVTVTVDTVGSFVAYNDLLIEEGTVYYRTLDDGDLP